MRTYLIKSLAVCGFALLAGCTSTNDSNNLPPERQPSDFDDVAVEMGSLGSGFLRKGVFTSPRDVTQVVTGVSRNDVRQLLGVPVNESSQQFWFYNINLPLEGVDDYLVCQYRVAFAEERVSGTSWRRPQCQARYEALIVPAQPQPIEPQQITLSSDVLFAFDSAELTNAGKSELSDAARVLPTEIELMMIDIVGHADRLGQEAYNLDLSRRRAQAVGAYFITQGIQAGLITTDGRGSSDPLVSCDGTQVTEALKNCLQPNRRVEITISGLR